MNKDRKSKDERKNRIFAEAFNYLRTKKVIKFRKELAEKMGVTPETISRILLGQVSVSDDAITRLQNACGQLFNYEWLQGYSDIMLAKDVLSATNEKIEASKEETIQALREQLAAKQELIDSLYQQITDLRTALFEQKNEDGGNYPFSHGVAEGREPIIAQ